MRPKIGLIILSSFLFTGQLIIPQKNGDVLGMQTENIDTPLTYKNSLVTKTAFEQTEIIENEELPYEIEYQSDPDVEYGVEEVTQEGINGIKTSKYLVTHWLNEVIDKRLISVDVQDQKPEIISRGTKIIWKKVDIDGKEIKYWYKLKVWATKYDANCYGCLGRTYTGTDVHQGVCAVDPKVIKLGTSFYVEGYGMCRAEDIGGAIKGNKIDLGFVDASKGNWGAAYTYIYLIDNPPN